MTIRVGQYHYELIPAVSADNVLLAHGPPDERPDLEQATTAAERHFHSTVEVEEACRMVGLTRLFDFGLGLAEDFEITVNAGAEQTDSRKRRSCYALR